MPDALALDIHSPQRPPSGDQRWRFAHQSVWEFLLASRLAGLLRAGRGDELLGEAQLTGLTIRFLRDLAPGEAAAWAARVGGGP
jgi:hypothetical protein